MVHSALLSRAITAMTRSKIAMLENVDDPKRDELVQKINEQVSASVKQVGWRHSLRLAYQNVARLEATIASLKAEVECLHLRDGV